MDDLEHTTAIPPKGGWRFRQSQTGWENPMAMVGRKASIDAIRHHRERNPAICAQYKLSLDPVAIEAELVKATRLRLGYPLPQTGAFFLPSNSLSSRVVAAVADIKKAAQGAAVPVDWFRSGGMPVDRDLAEKRAAICVACSENQAAPWYVEVGGEIIKSIIQARSDIKLETSRDADLKACAVCNCLLRAKVHVPLDSILSKTEPEILSAFPGQCWIRLRDKI